MLIFDALVGYFIFKIFGETGFWVLATTCMITVIRSSSNVNGFFNGMLQYFENLEEEEEE